MLPAVDAFAGIGGMTYALRGAVRTIAYCEIDPNCQAVLLNNMRRRLLPAAPIVPDVKALAGHHFSAEPVVVLGGFPCQDVSSAVQHIPLGAALGKQSRLVHYLFSFIDRHRSVQVVFLENVDAVVKHGHEYVIRSLVQRGFSVRWGLFSAEEVGALHVRKRWFCLAVRGHAMLRAVKVQKMPPLRAQRMVPYSSESRRSMRLRCPMLGNSVVPQCVAHAWNTLIRAPADPTNPVHVARRTLHTRHMFTCTPLRLSRPVWGTPTRTSWGQHRDLQRDSRTYQLANQLYYDDDTQAFLRKRYGWRGPVRFTDRHFSINPAWVEALMGYPAGWTLAF